jgi:DNA-binding NarL/FixJ family response regulator
VTALLDSRDLLREDRVVSADSTARAVRRLRVVVAEDAALLREGIVSLLRDVGHEVVGEARNGDELLMKVRSYSPDVAIIDMRMPPTHTNEGLHAAREIRAKHPDVGILVLSSYLEPSYAAELVADDASGVGYLLKDRVYDFDEFNSALDRVSSGGTAFDPKVVSAMVGRSGHQDVLASLSDREREVLSLMAEGRSNPAIARALVVSDKAVEKHVSNIFTKLDLPPAEDDHRRVLAVLQWVKG